MLIFKGSQVIKYYVMFAFLFVQTVQSPFVLSQKFQATSHLLRLYSTVCFGLGDRFILNVAQFIDKAKKKICVFPVTSPKKIG